MIPKSWITTPHYASPLNWLDDPLSEDIRKSLLAGLGSNGQ
jgi:hypothetical protein